ncbi:LD27042p [Strongyloides ratti]|uniref:LD27042p n=1 Tax=Strongyloides ratti TaxID=34506 RepID=A0A090KYN8_STRRB|nr:LD27042p [Strongyloides ratti]CEF62551.1 LD27042p [Strongyloides ratti]
MNRFGIHLKFVKRNFFSYRGLRWKSESIEIPQKECLVVDENRLVKNKPSEESLIEKYKELIFNDPVVKDAQLYMTPIDRDNKKNNFRRIIYNEGELDNTDLSKPPSPNNPHPFDPNKYLPPTHGRSLATYINHLPLLQNLVDIGVDLLDIDTNTKIGKHIVRLNWENDVLPKIKWLVEDVGVDVIELGDYLTRNPYFMLQDLNDMKVRVNYLSIKKFKKNEIAKIITESRYWINNQVQIIDKRLGWLQKTFKCKPVEIRNVIVKEPRVIMYGTGPIQRIVQLLGESEFLVYEQRHILLTDPRVFMMDESHIQITLAFCKNQMKLENKQIREYPLVLRCPIAGLKRRHTFLKHLKLAQYNPDEDNCVSLELFLHPSDKVFAEKAGRVTVDVYNNFIKQF